MPLTSLVVTGWMLTSVLPMASLALSFMHSPAKSCSWCTMQCITFKVSSGALAFTRSQDEGNLSNGAVSCCAHLFRVDDGNRLRSISTLRHHAFRGEAYMWYTVSR
jgi:hypothetical protein